MKFKYLTYLLVEPSLIFFDMNKTRFRNVKKIRSLKLKSSKKYRDVWWLEKKFTLVDIRGHTFIYHNAIGEKGANEIRILNMISIEDEIEKEGKWDTRRYNSIERPLKQKNHIFKVEKIKAKSLSVTSGVIGFILPSELFFDDGRVKRIKPTWKDIKMVDGDIVAKNYGFYYDWDNDYEIVGGFLKFENGKYDVYRCHVVKYKKVLKNSEVQIVFPCCSTSVEYNKDLIVQRWGVTNAYCKKCDKYHNNPDDLISRKNGRKIDYELFALEDSTNKTEEKEYGYIIKSKNEKLTNENMGFMF